MTKETKGIITAIMQGRDLEINLPRYACGMIESVGEYALIQFGLNYYTLSEVLLDGENVDSYIKECISDINSLAKRYIVDKEYDGDLRETDLKMINDMRDTIIKKMKVITSYVDNTQICEYVLNRVEYDVNGEATDVDVDELEDSIFSYIFKENDKMLINSKIQMITAQLPIRMTKNKFFDILSDSLSIYKTTDVKALDDFVLTIRSSAMLEKPEGFGVEYKDIYDDIETLKKCDFQNITATSFKESSDILKKISDRLNAIVTNYLMFIEIVNSMYAYILAMPYMENDGEYTKSEHSIVGGVYEAISNNKAVSEDVDNHLIDIEGRQEDIMNDIIAYEAIINDIKTKHKDIITAIMQEKIFESIYLIEKLQSSSLFIELDKDEDNSELVDNTYLSKCVNGLIEEFKVLFSDNKKVINRAVMSMVIAVLPVFFNNQEEIKEYINYSLEHCSSKSELTACKKLLEDIMEE